MNIQDQHQFGVRDKHMYTHLPPWMWGVVVGACLRDKPVRQQFGHIVKPPNRLLLFPIRILSAAQYLVFKFLSRRIPDMILLCPATVISSRRCWHGTQGELKICPLRRIGVKPQLNQVQAACCSLQVTRGLRRHELAVMINQYSIPSPLDLHNT